MTQPTDPGQKPAVLSGNQKPARLSAWPRWASTVIIAVGWGVCFSFMGYFQDRYDLELWTVAVGLGGPIAGAAIALLVYMATKPPRGYRLLLIPIGLFIAQWLQAESSRLGNGLHLGLEVLCMVGLWSVMRCVVCPLLVGLLLRWIVPGYRKGDVATLVGAWALPMAISWAIWWVVAPLDRLLPPYLGRDTGPLAYWALVGLIVGAVWGWVMMNQLGRLRRAESATPAPLPPNPE